MTKRFSRPEHECNQHHHDYVNNLNNAKVEVDFHYYYNLYFAHRHYEIGNWSIIMHHLESNDRSIQQQTFLSSNSKIRLEPIASVKLA